ncbi:MAG: transglutaminase-like cysteine peptidase [Alphaproteobacteria bacterium]
MQTLITKSIFILFLTCLAACATTDYSETQTPSGYAYKVTEQFSDMPEDQRVPNYYWEDFCKRTPGDCGVSSTQRRVDVGPQLWQKIQKINRWVNDRIIYRTDEFNNQGRDRMMLLDLDNATGKLYGDCEDHAVTKRHHLLRLGIPASALRLAEVAPMSNGMTYIADTGIVIATHMVLIIATNAGDFVLDNEDDYIQPVDRTGYYIAKFHMPEAKNPERWVIADAQPQLMSVIQ